METRIVMSQTPQSMIVAGKRNSHMSGVLRPHVGGGALCVDVALEARTSLLTYRSRSSSLPVTARQKAFLWLLRIQQTSIFVPFLHSSVLAFFVGLGVPLRQFPTFLRAII